MNGVIRGIIKLFVLVFLLNAHIYAFAEDEDTVYFQENFNALAAGSVPSMLDTLVNEKTAMYIEERSKTDKCLVLEGTANNLFVQSTYRSALSGKIYFSVDLDFAKINPSALMIELRDSGGNSNVVLRCQNGVILGVGKTYAAKYIENKVCRIEFEMDYDTGKISMWINGKQVSKNCSLGGLTDMYFVRIQLTQISSYSKVGIDNILLRSGIRKEQTQASGTENKNTENEVKKKMKKAAAFYRNRKNVIFNGVKTTIASAPFEEDGTLYMPLKEVMRLYSGSVKYNADTDTVETVYKNDKYILKGGQTSITKNGDTKSISNAVKIKDGVTYIPIEFLCSVIEKEMFIDKNNGLAIISDEKDFISWENDLEMLNEIVSSFIYTDYTSEQLLDMLEEKNPDNAHPRIMAGQEDFERIKTLSATDEFVKKGYNNVINAADKLLNQPASVYEKSDGLRLLPVSRRVLDRVANLAMSYKLTGEGKYAERAWLELYFVTYFPDWNEVHFLDTAEMSAAFAIGYDWLYDYLDDMQKERMRKTMIELGLKKGMDDYEKNDRNRTYRWSESVPPNNWTMVCNGGLAMSAMAIADDTNGEDKELCGKILENGLINVRRALTLFAPSGSYSEGVNYWNYATRYYVFYMKSLETALGGDLGYFDVPGMSNTVEFVESLNGPTGYYNFSDAASNTGVLRPAQMMWFAEKLNKYYLANPRINDVNAGKLTPEWEDLIYYPKNNNIQNEKMPLDKYSDIVETITMRSSYEDDALYVGFHNGSNSESHSHLDLGGFIIDSQGQRFITELGYDDYNLKGSVYDRYRYRAEGHNTLVINPDEKPDQKVDAVAKIIKHTEKPRGAYAIADLTSAYDNAESIKRGIMLEDGRKSVVVCDEISLKSPSEVWWFAHTEADIDVSDDGKTAVLTKKGKKFKATLISEGSFEAVDAKPLPSSPTVKGQNENVAYRKLAIHLNGYEKGSIIVRFSDYYDSSEGREVRELSEWDIPDGELEYSTVEWIRIDDKPLEGFKKDIYNYSIKVPSNQTIKNIVTSDGDVIDLRDENKTDGTVLINTANQNKAQKTYIITFEKEHLINIPDWLTRIPITKYEASAEPQAENRAANAFDKSFETRWAAEGKCSMTMDIGRVQPVFGVGIAFWKGYERVSPVKIEVSEDGINYTVVYEGESQGNTEDVEVFDTGDIKARYIKVNFYGTNVGTWNSILDLSVLKQK